LKWRARRARQCAREQLVCGQSCAQVVYRKSRGRRRGRVASSAGVTTRHRRASTRIRRLDVDTAAASSPSCRCRSPAAPRRRPESEGLSQLVRVDAGGAASRRSNGSSGSVSSRSVPLQWLGSAASSALSSCIGGWQPISQNQDFFMGPFARSFRAIIQTALFVSF